MSALGMKFDGSPTEVLPALAEAIENAGLDELWICEDLGLNGGIAQAAVALARTDNLRVGHGIAPAAVRNAAYYAMEVASLCRIFPGRFLPGLGHGMPRWLDQVGAHPGRLMTCLSETAAASTALWRGERVDLHGSWVNLDGVQLEWPPTPVPPLSLGVRGAKGMDLAVGLGAGVILAEGSGPQYVATVADRVKAAGGRVTVFTWFAMHDDQEVARRSAAPLAEPALGRDYMRSQLGSLAGQPLTDSILTEIAVWGTPEDCAASIRRLVAAGADAVVLQPVAGAEFEQLARIEGQLLPLLR